MLAIVGAVVNVAVAWASAFVGANYTSYAIYVEASDRDRQRTAFVLTAKTSQLIVLGFGLSPEQARDWYQPTTDVRPYWSELCQFDHFVHVEGAHGWPMLTLSWSKRIEAEHLIDLGGPGYYSFPDGSGVNVQSPGNRSLPLSPLAIGFVFNTLFYAVLLWFLVRCPFALRRFIRLKRRSCPACGYPMGESLVCSECGRPLPAHAVA